MTDNKAIDYRFKILYAIAMITVVCGHIPGGVISIISDWFPSFGINLAAFAFGAGYFYKSSAEKSVFKYVLKKFRSLIIPLYVYNIVYGLIVQVLRYKDFHIGGDFTLYNVFVAPITDGHQFIYNLGGWFVVPLFMVQVFNVVLRKALKLFHEHISEWVFWGISVILGILGNQLACMGCLENGWLVLVRMLYFIPFYSFGILYRDKLETLDRRIPSFWYLSSVFALKLIVICICGKMPMYTVSWCNDFTDGPIMPIVVGYLGIALWMRIAIILEPVIGKSKWINLIADNTYSIMINQFLGFMIVKTIFGFINKIGLGFADFDWSGYKNDVFWYYAPFHLSYTLILYIVAGLAFPIIFQKVMDGIKRKCMALAQTGRKERRPADHDRLQTISYRCKRRKNMDEILEYVLEKALPAGLTFQSERKNDSLYLPEIDTVITPIIAQVQETSVGIEFYVNVRKYDRILYEWCTGWGNDVFLSAASASVSFLFAFMSGLRKLFQREDPESFETEFADKHHKWKVFRGEIVAMGDPGEGACGPDAKRYWNLLNEEIKKRLGNQRMVYVKVFAARYPDEVIGECRIDDVAIPELGRMVADVVRQWPGNSSFTEKQFFFIEQNEETVVPSPYDGPDGRERLEKIVIEFLKLFRRATTEERYNRLPEDAARITNDAVLAAECVYFLPEIVSIHAMHRKFDGIYEVSDRVIFNMEDGAHGVYVSQLLDYDKLDRCICDVINQKAFGEETDDLYFELLGCSSVTKMIAELQKKDLRDLKPIVIYYNMGKGFQLR